jgi:hypothetical protein
VLKIHCEFRVVYGLQADRLSNGGRFSQDKVQCQEVPSVIGPSSLNRTLLPAKEKHGVMLA